MTLMDTRDFVFCISVVDNLFQDKVQGNRTILSGYNHIAKSVNKIQDTYS